MNMGIFTIFCLTLSLGANVFAASDPGNCLSSHNALRERHLSTPNLVWDEVLADEAKAWAEYLVSIGSMKHSNVVGQGENIYYAKSIAKAACVDASLSWYNEIALYNYKSPGFVGATGHFTQVVWKATTNVGVGIAYSQPESGQITTFIVAKYTPQGNFYQMGNMPAAFETNVKPKKSGAPAIPTRYVLDPSLCLKDNSASCSFFQQNGYCGAMASVMHSYCPKTCFC